MIGAAVRMTWQPVFVAGAVLWIGGAEKSQNELARGCERSTDLPFLEEVSQKSFVLDVVIDR